MVEFLDWLINNQYLIYAGLGFELTLTPSEAFYCQFKIINI